MWTLFLFSAALTLDAKAGSKSGGYVVNSLVEGGHEYESEMVFLGWSRDNRHYAFEIHAPNEGGHSCPYRSSLEIVDAKTDKWAKKSRLVVENKIIDDRDESCLYPTRRAQRTAFDKKKKRRLKKWNIIPGNLTEPVFFQSKGNVYIAPMPDGREAVMGFQSEKGHVANLGYFLDWLDPFERSIEKGKKRKCMNGYDLDRAFFSPDGSHVAFVIKKHECAFEGSLINFMTNGSPTKPK